MPSTSYFTVEDLIRRDLEDHYIQDLEGLLKPIDKLQPPIFTDQEIQNRDNNTTFRKLRTNAFRRLLRNTLGIFNFFFKNNAYEINSTLREKGIAMQFIRSISDKRFPPGIDPHCAKLEISSSEVLNKSEALGIKDTSKAYEKLYAEQEKNRRWKTATAIIVSVLSGGLLAIPAFVFWYLAKRKEPVKKIEMESNQYYTAKNRWRDYAKKEKIVPPIDAEQKIVRYVHKATVKRLEFFKTEKTTLSAAEIAMLVESKRASSTFRKSLTT